MSLSLGGVDLASEESGWVLGPETAEEGFAQALSGTRYTVDEIAPGAFILMPRTEDGVRRTDLPAGVEIPEDIILVRAEDEPDRLRPGHAGTVSQVSAKMIDARSIETVQDLGRVTAGLTTTNLGPGRNKLFIRGLSDGAFADRTQSTVGLLIGSVPVIFSDTTPELLLYDVAGVEILKGPQSTAIGPSSLGGMVRIVPARPDPKAVHGAIAAGQASTADGEGSWHTAGYLNLPLVSGKLAARISGYREDRGGFIDDSLRNLDDVNSARIEGLRAALRWQPDQRTALDSSAAIHEVRLADSQYATGGLTRQTLYAEPYGDVLRLWSLEARHDRDAIALRSSIGFTARKTNLTQDASSILLGTEFDEGTILPIQFTEARNIDALNAEQRIEGERGRFSWHLGAYASRREETAKTDLFVAFNRAEAFVTDANLINREAAIYGEFSYHFTSGITLLGGVRAQYADLAAELNVSGSLNFGVSRLVNDRAERDLLPRAAITVDLDPQTVFYVEAKAASRLGGLNINTPVVAFIEQSDDDLFTTNFAFAISDLDFLNQVDPFLPGDPTQFLSDRVLNKEVGIRREARDGRSHVSASAYHLDWRDIQTDQLLPSGLPFVSNAGDAEVFGVEFEFDWQLHERLALSGAMFANDAALTEPSPFLAAEPGARLPSVPRFAASLAADWQAFKTKGWSVTLSADTLYQEGSALLFSEGTSPRSDDVRRIDLRLGGERGPWRVEARAMNLLDNRANTFAFGNPFSFDVTPQQTPQRPRTLGFTVSRRF
ncbi:TonB-dependent receptor [Parvularcula lutaonensis]|uniref:TonB-dependent receptor n=1 Tax=Parvularcula lutaonensis TaxID=491923 RepID=A0ABV7MEV7_9PROT|nr:TonB-dependent receptor [Parvularcula lutaonensis]